MAVNKLTIPYPDFILDEIIQPDQFDLNNARIVEKVNEILSVVNAFTDGEGLVSGADLINIKKITPYNSDKLQLFLEEIGRVVTISEVGVRRLSETSILHEDAITKKANLSDVYTRAQLEPYLRGGDTLIRSEVFEIVNSNLGNGTFTYKDSTDTLRTGTISPEGHQVFDLQKGTYKLGMNLIKAIIGDTLQRSVSSGGLVEVSPTKVAITTPEPNGREIEFEYFERVEMAGEHSISYGITQPPVGKGNIMWFKEVNE